MPAGGVVSRTILDNTWRMVTRIRCSVDNFLLFIVDIQVGLDKGIIVYQITWLYCAKAGALSDLFKFGN